MGPIAKQFGATSAEGLPGGNNAAVFPDATSGAAAHFALLNKNYAGMPLSGAISKWSGGNSSPGYTDFIAKQTGLSPDTVLTSDLLSGPKGVALVKAQAQWEAGRPFPLTDDQWQEAQARGMGGASNAPAAPAAQSSGPSSLLSFGSLAPVAAGPPQPDGTPPVSPAASDPSKGLLGAVGDAGPAIQKILQQNKPAAVDPLQPMQFQLPAGLLRQRALAALLPGQGQAS